MSKRQANEFLVSSPSSKRPRLVPDRLSRLSDELILRVLHNVSTYTLTACQRVSHRFQKIAGDSQLWKAAYYDRFVRPRAHRLLGIKCHASRSEHLRYSSMPSKWLDEETLVKSGTGIDWKRKYKIRHNWSRGSCAVGEISVANRPPKPGLLARLHEGIVYTVDAFAGLRAWSYKYEEKLLASQALERSRPLARNEPSSIAMDGQDRQGNHQQLAVGFEDGSYSIYSFNHLEQCFSHSYTHPSSSNGQLSALAFASPYLLVMSEAQTLSLYKLGKTLEDTKATGVLHPPRLLTSLKSHTVWPPLSLSLRFNAIKVVACIAYSLPTYQSGWSVGVQELHFTPEGDLLESRLATSVSQGFSPLSMPSSALHQPANSLPLHSLASSSQTTSKPTSLSYSHPYLLVSNSDNTLTFYLVTSTSSRLSVNAGKRLWGHTSSVFGAQVGGRGKAVSVSTRGNDVRVWELEGSAIGNRLRHANCGVSSIRVTAEKKSSMVTCLDLVSEAIARRGNGLGLALEETVDDMAVTRGWVGFDEENVVVLREQRHGNQALTIYDFT